MKKWIFALMPILLAVAGCADIRPANGKYTTALPGREDVAFVYGDLIFLRLRNAECEESDGGYWDWAGKYKVIDGKYIELDMDRQTKRTWKFYYQLTMQGKGIAVEDLRAENSYLLHFRAAAPPAKSGGDGSAPAAYPAYR